MNLLMTKSEDLDFPNFETWLYSNCKARIAEFNRFGTLLAIGCKYGMVLVMDFVSKEIVRIFDYVGSSNLQFNSEISNFIQFSNGDYNQIFDLFEHDTLQSVKKVTKIPSPRSKDHEQIIISGIAWSYDSNFLLVSYQGVNTIVLWNVESCEKVYQVPIDSPGFIRAQLYPYNANIAIISATDPYVIDMKTKEFVKFLKQPAKPTPQNKEKEEKKDPKEPKEEGNSLGEWQVISLSKNDCHYFLLVNSENEIILVKEKANAMEDIISSEQEEDISDIKAMINQTKFSVISALKLTINGKISSVTYDDTQKFVLLNATDRCLRLLKISFKQKMISIERECVDVINRKKWMTAGFFTVRHPTKEDFIVSGVGESGSHEICFISTKTGTIVKRLGPSKEGCLHICSHCTYHNSIVVVTCNGDLLYWSVHNPKCWTSLAPEFTEIEENIEYIEKEDEFDSHNMIYVPPVTDPTEILPIEKKSTCFDVSKDFGLYVNYSMFGMFAQSENYLPQANLIVVKPAIKSDFLTMKGKADIKKLKEKMEAKGVKISKATDEGIIEIVNAAKVIPH